MTFFLHASSSLVAYAHAFIRTCARVNRFAQCFDCCIHWVCIIAERQRLYLLFIRSTWLVVLLGISSDERAEFVDIARASRQCATEECHARLERNPRPRSTVFVSQWKSPRRCVLYYISILVLVVLFAMSFVTFVPTYGRATFFLLLLLLLLTLA